MKIYVASSWRNVRQPEVVRHLAEAGHDVYDFRHPRPGDEGFHWSEVDQNWQNWTPAEFRDALDHPVARRGFDADMLALLDCDACVLVLPCGRSAHLEAGHAAGAGKRVIILLGEEPSESELMYKMAEMALTIDEVINLLSTPGCRK